VNGLPVFIRSGIGGEIYGLAADMAAYSWIGSVIHRSGPSFTQCLHYSAPRGLPSLHCDACQAPTSFNSL